MYVLVQNETRIMHCNLKTNTTENVIIALLAATPHNWSRSYAIRNPFLFNYINARSRGSL